MTQEELHQTLERVRAIYSQTEIGEILGRDPKTIRRWENGQPIPAGFGLVLRNLIDGLTPQKPGTEFTFIDLFAGIGGFRLGVERQGGKCIFTSEYDKYCQKTYLENFRPDHPFAGDIRAPENQALIPSHDLLVGGFPCQPFSIAGVSKKRAIGQPDGFACEAQGTLFFEVAKIIKRHKPAAFLLENVKNLRSHDGGKTFEVIMRVLREELGYHATAETIDAKGLVPQHRERIFIVGFRDDVGFNWNSVKAALPPPDAKAMGDILHPQNGSEVPEEPYTLGTKAKVNPKYILTDHMWDYLRKYANKHKDKGNGFGYGKVTKNSIARTLSARYYKDGSEILVDRRNGNPRRLTPRECARLMGFDSYGNPFRVPVSDTQAYKQFGNAVVPLVVEKIVAAMKPGLMAIKAQESTAESPQMGIPWPT